MTKRSENLFPVSVKLIATSKNDFCDWYHSVHILPPPLLVLIISINIRLYPTKLLLNDNPTILHLAMLFF